MVCRAGPLFLLMMEASKRTATPENKNGQKLQIGHVEAGKTMVHHLFCCESGGRNNSWLCAWKDAPSLCLSQPVQLGHPYLLQMADVATAIDEWLHTLLLVTSESQIIRKCEHSY